MISDYNALGWVGTPSGRMLAKWSVLPLRFPHLLEMAKLTRWLYGQGLPVSAPVPARDGRLQIEVDGVSIGLQREVEGDLLDTSDPGQVREAGAVLARLLDAMAAYRRGRFKGSLHFKNITDTEYETRGFGASSVIPANPFAVYARIEIGLGSH